MQVDALAIALRPRPMAEAADLGQRLVHAHARSVWRCYLPLWLAVMLLALATLPLADWAPVLVIFVAKPWLDRGLLFVLARAVFGESTRWADLWAARREVLVAQWPATLTLARLSPWRAFTLPVAQLEGQRGKPARQRRRVLLAARQGAAMGLQFVYANLEVVATVALYSLVVWFLPERFLAELWQLWKEGGSLPLNAAATLAYGAVVLLLEPFYVGAGLAMYLNRRVELEAWDVEQEFRLAFA